MMLVSQLAPAFESIGSWLVSSAEPILIEGEVGCGKTFIVKVGMIIEKRYMV